MKIYALGDLHLSFSSGKPMDVFGDHWKDHHLLLQRNWQEQVREEDLVLLPGDLSWAMTLDEAQDDLMWLESLPGKKIICKGNHDYWWTSISRLRKMLLSGIIPLQQKPLLPEREDGSLHCRKSTLKKRIKKYTGGN